MPKFSSKEANFHSFKDVQASRFENTKESISLRPKARDILKWFRGNFCVNARNKGRQQEAVVEICGESRRYFKTIKSSDNFYTKRQIKGSSDGVASSRCSPTSAPP